jgi:hypothetical protein
LNNSSVRTLRGLSSRSVPRHDAGGLEYWSAAPPSESCSRSSGAVLTVGLSESACRSKSRPTAPVAIGRGEQARPELSATIEGYRTMEMSFWLPQAEAVLAQGEES